ncbi:MAG: hypothetical protein N3A38_04075 [Planctomycetota bacterium]|nr:hypothetical protein [Planctomycetota bacterium]
MAGSLSNSQAEYPAFAAPMSRRPLIHIPACCIALVWVVAAALGAGELFTARPSAAREGEGAKISFVLSAPTDVEVAVLDAGGKIVRHLAAGVLGGKNPPPEPLRPGLAQEIVWDGKDDSGRPAAGGPFRARISAGTTPRLERHVGWDGRTLGYIASLAVGPGGEVFVLLSESFWGRSEVRVYSREGKYLRTILPWPADAPPGRTASVGHLDTGGERVPIVFNGHSCNLAPLTAGLKTQTMAVHPKGWVVMFSAVGTMAEHGPPRHLLALHPEGGAPEGVPFVGPRILRARGFLGGSGDATARFFDHAAFSPDGKWIYLTTSRLIPKDEDPRRIIKPRHAVFRVTWSDDEIGAPFLGKDGEPGTDDSHFNDPQGLATDPDGNIYVCDRGNDRVAVFSADGGPVGKFPVEDPAQVFVSRKDRTIYVFSKAAERKVASTRLFKFAPLKDGTSREIARADLGAAEVVALDALAEPPIVWCGIGKNLVPARDEGGKFEVGKPVNDNEAGLEWPMFLAPDIERGRIFVRERSHWLYQVDLKTGRVSLIPIKGADIALDRTGNIYVLDGYGTDSLSRYTPDFKPLPFPATGTHKLKVHYRAYGPNLGMRGLRVAPSGDIYVLASTNYGGPDVLGGRLHVFGPDGRLKNADLIPGLGYGDCGVGVDARGNVYVGVNIKPEGRPVPEWLEGKVPASPWLWWRKSDRQPPWSYPFCNPYLFYCGTVLKFPPTGGAIYGHDIAEREGKRTAPTMSAANAPKDAVPYRSSYLSREVRVAGALWAFQGAGPIPGSSDGPSPDPGCVCFPSRLDADEYGRVYIPNVFRSRVEMLDAAGNPIAGIGRYGNADSAGPGSAVPDPEIAFAWPAFVAAGTDGKLYVSDSVNRRVTIVRFERRAEAECEVR